jgi:hypothetical protein
MLGYHFRRIVKGRDDQQAMMWESPTKVSLRKNNVHVVHPSSLFHHLLLASLSFYAFHGFLCMTCGVALGSVVTHGCVFAPKHLQVPQPLVKVSGLEHLGWCLNPVAVLEKVKKSKAVTSPPLQAHVLMSEEAFLSSPIPPSWPLVLCDH